MKNLICAVTVLTVSTAQADTIYVDAKCPGGDGSVGDPYCSIQTAIDNAVDTDEIVVAPGTYFEAIDLLGKAVNLHSSDGPEVTTIDGTGNFHVVQCVSGEGADTVLSGFVITGGNANGGGDDDHGGGMLNDRGSPTVTNCTFSGNTAARLGGGMFNDFSSPTVTNCTFEGNTADFDGGGMCNLSGSPTVINCTFSGNSTINLGGGMFNISGNLTVLGCTFSGNSANVGGGMSNSIAINLTVTDCTFERNTADQNGGGMYSNRGSPTLTNCRFSGNSAVNGGGGGMYNFGGSPTLTNCTFSENSAGGDGGAMRNGGSSPTVTNCILWNDSPDEFFGFAALVVTYSNVQGGYLGTGNIDADPLFVDPDNGNYRLSPGSPCIDAGDNTAVPLDVVEDLDGNPRFVDAVNYHDTGNGDPPIVDMGVYEADAFTPSPLRTTGDILWHHDDGAAYIWLMDGVQLVGAGSPGGANLDWEIAGVGDFDGDSHADILWRHMDSGQVVVWYINGTQFDGSDSLGGLSHDWMIEGIANFDGLNGDDILWRHTNGQSYIWLMNGADVVGQGSPGSVGQVWQIAGVGDFDGDGYADILWQRVDTGQIVIWFIEGTVRVDGGVAGSVDPNVWEIAGIGDFDGLASTPTSTADILWRRDNGQVVIWLMDGTLRIGQGSPGTVGQVWQVAGIGDLDGDSLSDILWRNQSPAGQVFVWFIEGTARVDHGSLGGVSQVWQIAETADFDGE